LNALESAYRRIILRDHIACVMAAASNIATVKGPLRLLDVGCGNGTLLKLLQRRGFDVFGYESSDEAARIANDEGVNVVSGETLETAEFGAASLDIVTLFHVMEHVPEPRAILAEVRRILRPSGRILVQVPNIESWQSKLCGARWYGLDVPRHIINYSSYSIRRLLLDCGFRIRRVRHFNLRDNAAAFASSISPGLDPMSRCVRASRHRRREPAPVAWAKHAVYVALVAAVYPLVVAESVCGAGGTLMLEAEKA
jgi:SAM-dependent methyltransferase